MTEREAERWNKGDLNWKSPIRIHRPFNRYNSPAPPVKVKIVVESEEALMKRALEINKLKK